MRLYVQLMSASYEALPTAPPFRLETFRTLMLHGSAGHGAVTDHGQQGRRLALLAVLAASGERGCSRDQLLLLFWPEASQQRARHSLEQLLYAIRRSMDGSVFVGVNPLRLNPAVITSDVVDFEHALSQGHLAAAVGHYRGPFLEGFYLSDSPEFEQWVDAQRSRLEADYTDALERLAQAAETDDDYATAVQWRRKLTDVDPLSSRNAIGLMSALANAGDHTAALRYAERYERLVAQELGTSTGPEIASLASEIRARERDEPSALRATTLAPQEKDRGSTTDRGERIPTRGGTPPPQPMRPPVLYAVAAFLLVAVIFAATRLRNEPVDIRSAGAGEPSIAVLPLANLSTDPRDAALADGMTEELIAILAKMGDLRVIASTSAFAFKDRQIDVRSIADSLRVSNILEGSLQKIGSRLRVQVRLVDARDGSTRWSETYDREIEDVFAVQEDIAQAVARELGARLGGRAATRLSRRTTPNVAAYELYLRGSDPALLRSDSGVQQGVEYFKQAIAADSTYAAAYAGLARMYLTLSSRDDPGMPVRDLHALSEQAARKAVSLDDSLAEAHAVLGLVHKRTAYDFASSESELKRAIDLDPTYGLARQWLAIHYIFTGRPEEALAEARRALENDPLSPSAHAEVAHALLANGRYDEALAQLEHIAGVQPPLLRTAVIAAQAYAKKGMLREAIATLRPQAEKGGSHALSLYGYLLARAGQREEANRILQTLLTRRQRTGVGASHVALVYAGLGDSDQTFAWLDRSIDDRSLSPGHIHILELAPRGDPRLERLKERLGLQNR